MVSTQINHFGRHHSTFCRQKENVGLYIQKLPKVLNHVFILSIMVFLWFSLVRGRVQLFGWFLLFICLGFSSLLFYIILRKEF